MFASPPTDPDEKDLVSADFDNDGDPDILSVRKENFYATGSRSHRLFINNGGVLVDQSSMVTGPNYASRDVAVLDADGDGFLDFVVANTTSGAGAGTPAPVGLYINNTTTAGNFAGFTAASGWLTACTNPCAPATCGVNLRSCAIAAGDVNGDGIDDIWATTYGPGGLAGPSLSGDRLYVSNAANPGTFTDVSFDVLGCDALDPTAGMTSAAIADFDGDGLLDLFRAGPFASPGGRIFFNTTDPATGILSFGVQGGVPIDGYMATIVDMNGDNAPDVFMSRDQCDHAVINPSGPAARNSSNWTKFKLEDNSVHNKLHLGASGGGNVFFGDLDGDGFLDIGTGDIDTSVPTSLTDPNSVPCMLRNRSVVAGNFGGLEDPDALEQLTINISSNSVWDGLIVDLDGDGVPGVFYATEAGYRYFTRLPFSESYGPLTPNSVGNGARMRTVGRPSLSENNFTVLASAIPANVFAQVFFGLSETFIPLYDGNLLIGGPLTRLPATSSSAAGVVTQPLDFTSSYFTSILAGTTLRFQVLYRDPGFGATGVNLTNGVRVTLWD